MVVKTQLS